MIWGAAIRKAGKLINHIHIADNDRYYQGHGHINFREIIRALKDIEYDGTLALEIFLNQKQALCPKIQGVSEIYFGGGLWQGKKDRKFVSIGKKIIWNITIITVIVAIIFSIYIYSSMQKKCSQTL